MSMSHVLDDKVDGEMNMLMKKCTVALMTPTGDILARSFKKFVAEYVPTSWQSL